MNIEKDLISGKMILLILLWIIGGLILVVIGFVELIFLGGANRLYNGLAEIISLTVVYIEKNMLFFSMILWAIVTAIFLVGDELK